MSSQPADHGKRQRLDNLRRFAIRGVKFDSFDRIIIVCIIAVFAGLFMWLLGRNDQPFYSYLTFLVLVTLVLTGILRAVGVFQTPIMLFGGAAAVFAGLFLLTKSFYDKSYDQSEQIGKLKEQIGILTCSDPACATLKRYFYFIESAISKLQYRSYQIHGNTTKNPAKARIITTTTYSQHYSIRLPAMKISPIYLGRNAIKIECTQSVMT